RAVAIIRLKRMIKFDHPGNEGRREDADTSVIEQIDAPFICHLAFPHGIIAKMRVAMNDAIARKRPPPRGEHDLSNAVAAVEPVVAEAEYRRTIQPVHGEKAACAQTVENFRHRNARIIAEDFRIKADMRGLAAIIEFFMQPLCNLRLDFARVDGAVHSSVNGKDERKLL